MISILGGVWEEGREHHGVVLHFFYNLALFPHTILTSAFPPLEQGTGPHVPASNRRGGKPWK
jgi:hypothetical protein